MIRNFLDMSIMDCVSRGLMPDVQVNNEEKEFEILYGTQTGTAKTVAEQIAKIAFMHGLPVPIVVKPMNYRDNLANLAGQKKEKVIVFVAATTGNGEPPETMRKFWKWMISGGGDLSAFQKIKYGVIALGDSSYEQFNFVGKKLDNLMKLRGATQWLPICLGDDQHELGYSAAVDPWIEQFFETLRSSWGINPPSAERVNEVKRLSTFELVTEPLTESDLDQRWGYIDFSTEPYECEITENQRVTHRKHWQDTRLITIDVAIGPCNYKPGDVLVIQPSNLATQVVKFFTLFPDLKDAPPVLLKRRCELHWATIAMAIIEKLDSPPWSWDSLVTHLFDIQCVPKPQFFEIMARFAEDERERERLEELSSPKGQDDLRSYCNIPRRTCLEVLEDFPNTTRSIAKHPEYLYDLFGPIRARSFSIASSKRQMFDAIQILVAVVEYKTKMKESRKGLCSNWLAERCRPGTKVRVWVEEGTFKFPRIDPDETDMPLIMIGPGTGIAPFRSFVHTYRRPFRKIVIFGCRNEKADYYFQNEWKRLEEDGHCIFLTAFSRDGKGNKRQYVQDVIRNYADFLKETFQSSPEFHIFVAGSAKNMPREVKEALFEVMRDAGIKNPELKFEGSGDQAYRYQTETWS